MPAADHTGFGERLGRRPEVSGPIVACTLSRAGLGEQLEGWRSLWEQAGIDCAKTHDGIRLTFRDEPAVETELRRLASVENDCCSWATWEVSREDGALWMRAGASGAGTVALHGMFDGGALGIA